LDSAGSTQNLSNVNVGAVLIDLRVVRIENGVVNARHGGDPITSVIQLHDIGSRAVLALPTKAKAGTGLKVVARCINGVNVDYRELVGRNIVCSRDAVANITVLNGVSTSARLCEDELSDKRDGEETSNGFDEHSYESDSGASYE